MENRIKELREERNLSQYDLAERAETTAQQIGRLEKGTRKLTVEWLTRLSKALVVDPEDILVRRTNITTINKIGFVEAGNWQEATQLPVDEWEPICYEANSNMKGKHIFALGVRGNSMNRIFPEEKTTLICCDVADYPYNIENGDYIIAQRISPDGKYEATVKRYTRIDDNTVILTPESTDTSFQPIVITANDNNGYEIKAVVIDYQMKLKKV